MRSLVSKNDARTALVGEISPCPVDEHDEPAAEADQEIYMQQQPEPLGEYPGQTQLRQLRYRGVTADGGKRAPVPIAERRGRARLDQREHVLGDERAHLLGGWRDSRH